MDDYIDYRQAEALTAREVQEILKVGYKTVYSLFAGDCPFRVVKIPGGYRIHAKSFFELRYGAIPMGVVLADSY